MGLTAPFVLTQEAMIFARVLTVACGAIPLPGGVVASAAPVEISTRLAAVANAFRIAVWALEEPEVDTWVASVAKPAKE